MTADTTAYTSSIRVMNRKIMPVIMILYLIAYIDRSNISIAALAMNADLSLTAEMYGFAVGMFFVSYILFEVPSNVILTRIGARIWIARIMISWGIVAGCIGFVQSATQLYIMRFLLGAAEAGFTPGIIYYLSCWYPKSDRARAMSLFYIGAALASVIGLPLSGTILGLHGLLDVAGWRWVFILEGLPAIAMGIFVLCYLQDGPETGNWLNPEQKAWLAAKLAAEDRATPIEGSHSWSTAFTSRTVWMLSLLWLLQAFGTIGITYFMPLIVRSIAPPEYGNLGVSLLSAVPFLFACIFMYINGRSSDLRQERAWHLGAPLALSGILLGVALYTPNTHLAYGLLVLTVAFNWAITPVFWAVTTERLSGVASAASIALINAVANFAGLGLPPIIGHLKDNTGNYNLPLLLIACALVLGGLLGIWLGRPMPGQPARDNRIFSP